MVAGRRGTTPDAARPQLRSWRPGVHGVVEVFHARFVGHAYPAHTHDAWTLLIVDDGAIRYDLDRHPHGAVHSTVTLLPPHVPHDGQPATGEGFRKRVLYLDPTLLSGELIGPAVDRPGIDDPLLRHRIHQLHLSLNHPGDAFEAESRLALVRDRLSWHLRQQPGPEESMSSPTRNRLADRLRALLDASVPSGITLREAGEELHAHPSHLIRSFTAAFGLPPHAYLTGRRIDLARRLLLAGQRPAEVAAAAGFYDQPHLTRHFRRYLGVSPARFVA